MKLETKIIHYFAQKYKYDLSFVDKNLLLKVFCVNSYQRLENCENLQYESKLELSNKPLSLIGEKVLKLIITCQMYDLDLSLKEYEGMSKKEEVAFVSRISDKMNLFKFAYIKLDGVIETKFAGDDGSEKKASLIYALIGAIYLSLDKENKSIGEVKKFINKFVK